MFAKCSHGDIIGCNASINDFSKKGWRTLALAYKNMNEKEYEAYNILLTEAYNDIKNRDEKLMQAYEQIESDLVLVGATAIEDRLQEDVPKTLEALRMGGIKIWVLTGDKKETALNISYSCKHFTYDMKKLFLTDLQEMEEIKTQLKSHQKK